MFRQPGFLIGLLIGLCIIGRWISKRARQAGPTYWQRCNEAMDAAVPSREEINAFARECKARGIPGEDFLRIARRKYWDRIDEAVRRVPRVINR